MMRLGILGPGLIWNKRHKPSLDKLKAAFEITAFCAASERRKSEVLRDYPHASFDTDFKTFINRPDIDAVVVLTPIHLNGPLALEALKAGKDVFLEKPMAHSYESGKALVETAGQTGKRLWVLEQEVYHPRWQGLKDLLASGEIGEMVYYDYIVHWPLDSKEMDRGGYGRTTWRIEPTYPLGAIFDGGHHQIALLSKLFGVPEWLFASGVQLRQEFGEYDHISIQFGYAQPLRGVFSHSAYLGEVRNSFTIWGTKGALAVGDNEVSVLPYNGAPKQIPSASCEIHDVMWQTFADCILTGKEPGYTTANAWADLTILLAVEQSIKTQNPVITKFG